MSKKFRLGKILCDEGKVSPEELATYCSAGELAAYGYDDRRLVFDAKQCRKKFIFPASTSFTIRVPDGDFLAIYMKNIQDIVCFCYQNTQTGNINIPHHKNSFMDSVLHSSHEYRKLHFENVQTISIQYENKEYTSYYTNMLGNFYHNYPIKFKIPHDATEIELEFIIIDASGFSKEHIDKDKIHPYKTNIFVKKINDTFGEKCILSKYNDALIEIEIDYTVRDYCTNIDESRIPTDQDYAKKYCEYKEFLYQYGLNYFDQNDNQLKFGKDYFIFDFTGYKQRFYYLDSNDVAKSNFFECIKKFMYDEGQLQLVHVIKKEIADAPKVYMIKQCKSLVVKYENYIQESCENKFEEKRKEYENDLRIVQSYLRVIKHPEDTWRDIYDFVWKKDKNDKARFINHILKQFEKIARDNQIPFIPAQTFRKMKKEDNDGIVNDMLQQIEGYQRQG